MGTSCSSHSVASLSGVVTTNGDEARKNIWPSTLDMVAAVVAMSRCADESALRRQLLLPMRTSSSGNQSIVTRALRLSAQLSV